MKDTDATLFIVDDDPQARAGVAALAFSLGIPCERFPSAEDFLARADTSRPGCLLLDLRLSGMNGLKLQAELRRMGSCLPVILVSAFADVPTTVKAMQNGALTVLEKPYSDDQLIEAVGQAIDRDAANRAMDIRCADTQRRVATLDDRERQFMELMIVGTPGKNIARALGVSHRTADRIRATIYEKMGVESATEVACLVSELQASQTVG